MNRLPALAISSIIAVSLPGASAADERLDAPGPGYRQQVERFSPRGVSANPFQLQIEPTLGSVESPIIVRTSELFSITEISAPGVLFEADRLEAPDPGYREQVERFSRNGNGTASFRLELAPAEFPARMPKGSTAHFLRAVELPSGIAPLDEFDFSQPIRLFDLPRTFGVGDTPSMSIPERL
jgi:hypothetical protein